MVITLPQDRFTAVNGARTRYWVQGGQGSEGERGSPVVLIHGLGGFVENWVYNMGPLAAHRRVYALDLLGFGQTDKTPLIHDLNRLVDFIRGFMDALEIGKASLVGNSLGGGLALQFALDYPEKVDKLVLADNAGMGREVCADFRFCMLPLVNRFIFRRDRDVTARVLEKLVYDPAVLTPDFKDTAKKYSNAPGALEALLSVMGAGIDIFGQKSKLTRALLKRLPALAAPTLIIWGRQDRIIPVSHARKALEHIPGARLEIFDKCGHMPQYEQPDKFNRVVLDFLDEKPYPVADEVTHTAP